jgi:hypothetical protein
MEKKKRGRKVGSKNNDNNDNIVQNVKPKKRGRKPKENIIINNNPIFANDNDNIDDLIIKLNKNKNDNNNNDNNNDNYNNNILYTINELELDQDQDCDISNISEVCWNCCHSFNNIIIGLPINYNNNIFYTIGDFCSLECATRYAFDNYNEKIYEIIPIINMYNNIKFNNINKITLAPSKLILKKFGGTMDIEEYRKNFNNNIYYINLPIIIPINNNIYKYEFNNSNNIKDLKLYRKKELNTTRNSIFNKMNLDIS